jgi:hypothetical protein
LQRLRELGAVAIERIGFKAELPGQHIRVLAIRDRRRIRHVDGFGDRARNEGLGRGQHADVALDREEALAVAAAGIGAVKNREMLFQEERRTFQSHGAAAIGVRRVDLGFREAQRRQHVEAGIVHLLGGEAESRFAEFLAQGPFVEGEADVERRRQRLLQGLDRAFGEALGLELLVVECGRIIESRIADGVACNRLDLGGSISEGLQCLGHSPVDDAEIAAAREFLELDEREIGLDAGGVAIHDKAGRTGRRDHGRLRVAITVALAEGEGDVPSMLGGLDQRRDRAMLGVERDREDRELLIAAGLAMRRAAMVADDAQHVVAIGLVAGEGAELAGHLGRGRIGLAANDRGERGAVSAALVAVIG